jgi:thiamine-phosphate pyrophosphorylase
VDAGVDLVQVRESDLEAGALVSLVGQLLAIARGTPTRIVVNDRIDVALASGADGVHLRGDSIPVGAARQLAPAGFLIGRSVHRVEEAIAAADADYLIAGTVFPSASKAAGAPLLGVEGLKAVARSVERPVLAIGGISDDRLGAVASAAPPVSQRSAGSWRRVTARPAAVAGPFRFARSLNAPARGLTRSRPLSNIFW